MRTARGTAGHSVLSGHCHHEAIFSERKRLNRSPEFALPSRGGHVLPAPQAIVASDVGLRLDRQCGWPAVSAATAPQNLCRIPTRTVLWRSLVDGVKTLMAATAVAPVESVPEAFW